MAACCLLPAVAGLQLSLTISNSGYSTLSNIVLEGWPGLTDALQCTGPCTPDSFGNSYGSCPTTLMAARLRRYQRLQCQGTYACTEDERYMGAQTRNVTIAGVSSTGKRVTTTLQIYTRPSVPEPNARIRTDYNTMRGCEVDMEGERGFHQKGTTHRCLFVRLLCTAICSTPFVCTRRGDVCCPVSPRQSQLVHVCAVTSYMSSGKVLLFRAHVWVSVCRHESDMQLCPGKQSRV
jgi:hypothetical protein